MRAAQQLVLALAAFTAAPVFTATTAFADGFIITSQHRHFRGCRCPRPIRPRPPLPLPPLQAAFPLWVEHHDVKVTIDGPIATTVVDQTFRNPLNRRLEGTYMFPIPADAALDQFSMWINGKEMQGELLDSKKALGIYEGIVRSMRDPALLQYAGRGMFKVRIFPIEPNSTKRVKLTYRQTLTTTAGRCRYRYPLNTEKFSSKPLKRASIVVSIKSDEPIKGIYSPWHDVDVRRKTETTAVASWEAKNVTPNRDFVLDYDMAKGDVGMSLRTNASPAEDGTFLLVVSPKVEVPASERQPKDVVFVFDTSGSMAADKKMEQARRALQYMIQRLDAKDRFAVVDYATDARAYRDALVSATDEQKQGAAAYVKALKARGGTAIDEALQKAFTYHTKDATRPFTVVFMTDGEPTIGERAPDRILANLKRSSSDKNARVFVWGVGNDLNAGLLDQIAKAQRGDSYYVLPGENIEVSMSSFYDKIDAPALTDLKLSFTNVRVRDVYPRQLGDLFFGSQLLITGRFTGEGAAAVRLTGTVNGKQREFVYEGKFERADTYSHIPRLWAKKKIGFLLDQIRLHGPTAELKKEVVRLARRHGLPTPYTSYLVLEEGARIPRPQPLGRANAPADDAARTAFRRLRQEAKKSAEGEGGGFNEEAPAAGKPAQKGRAGVGSARRAGELRRSERDDVAKDIGLDRKLLEKTIRTVEGKTFYKAGDVWVDSTVGKRKPTWKQIAYMSEAYFALLKKTPSLGAFLSLGKLIVRTGDTVYEIK